MEASDNVTPPEPWWCVLTNASIFPIHNTTLHLILRNASALLCFAGPGFATSSSPALLECLPPAQVARVQKQEDECRALVAQTMADAGSSATPSSSACYRGGLLRAEDWTGLDLSFWQSSDQWSAAAADGKPVWSVLRGEQGKMVDGRWRPRSRL